MQYAHGMVAVAMLSWGSIAAAQTVRLEVASAWSPRGLHLYAETTWLGEDRTVELTNDGTAPGDRAGDNVWTATWEGEPVRMLPIRILAEADGFERREIGAGMEVVSVDDDRLGWVVEDSATPRARRSALAWPGRDRKSTRLNSSHRL